MKIRNGFVSNSSSSSFVILLPENFKLDLSDVDFEDYEVEEKDVQDAFDNLLRDKEIWDEEYGEENEVLGDALEDYIVATIDTSPEGGQLILADPKKVKKILLGEKNED